MGIYLCLTIVGALIVAVFIVLFLLLQSSPAPQVAKRRSAPQEWEVLPTDDDYEDAWDRITVAPPFPTQPYQPTSPSIGGSHPPVEPSTAPTNPPKPPSDLVDISRFANPISYTITLHVEPYGFGDTYKGNSTNPDEAFWSEKKDVFMGHVKLEVVVVDKGNEFVLNAKGLKINTGESFIIAEGGQVNITDVEYINQETRWAVVRLKTAKAVTFSPGERVTLSLLYSGKIVAQNSGKPGLRRFSTFDHDIAVKKGNMGNYSYSFGYSNKTSHYIYTQPSPQHAREMVPCFDDPAYKAKWSVSLRYSPDIDAYLYGKPVEAAYMNGVSTASNQTTNHHRVKRQGQGQDENNYQRLVVELIASAAHEMAFVMTNQTVFDIENADNSTIDGVVMDVYMMGRNQMELWLPETRRICAATKRLFADRDWALNYNIRALLFVALPFQLTRVGQRTMENSGVVYMREIDLDFQQSVMTTENELVSQLLVSEKAAGRFGRIMHSWNDSWISDGFARFNSYAVVSSINSNDSSVSDLLLLMSTAAAMEADRRIDLAVQRNVHSPEEYDKDAITSDKTAAILAMMQKLVGEQQFRQALSRFMKADNHSSSTEQFFQAFDDAKSAYSLKDNKPAVRSVLEQYILQPGIPLLRLRRTSITQVEITQERFPTLGGTSDMDVTWDVPIWYTNGNSSNEKMEWLLKGEKLTIEASAPVVLNVGGYGYYNVRYDEEELVSIGKQFETSFQAYSPRTRVALLFDLVACVARNRTAPTVARRVLSYLPNETDPTVWIAVLNNRRYVSYILASNQDHPENPKNREKAFEKLFANRIANMPLEEATASYGDSRRKMEMYAYTRMVDARCRSVKECLDASLPLFHQNTSRDCRVWPLDYCYQGHPAWRRIAYCAAVYSRGITTLENFPREPVSMRERLSVQLAKSCTQKPLHLVEQVSSVLSPDSSLTDDERIEVLDALLSNELVPKMYLDHVVTNWDRLYKHKSLVVAAASMLHRAVNDENDLRKLLNFVEKSPTANHVLKRVLDVEAINFNVV